jgi:hypothetical protein
MPAKRGLFLCLSVGQPGRKRPFLCTDSAVAWHNINLNGTYSFNFEHNLIDIEEIMRPITENSGDI